MKMRRHALGLLAMEESRSVARLTASGVRFGPEYLIPSPFDPRVLLWVAPQWLAAVASGVALDFVERDATARSSRGACPARGL